MPWSITDEPSERRGFIAAVLAHKESFAAACERFGISRKSGYKWWARFQRAGWSGLRAGSRQPRRAAQLQARWQAAVLRLRRRHRWWGAAKLRVCLRRTDATARLPSVSTIQRWLRAAGLTRRHARRARKGPSVPRPAAGRPRRANDVWTIDFKGSFRVGDRRRLFPLTVRDLVSRYVLAVCHVAQPDDTSVRTVLTRLFRRHGLPRAIQVDNGTPFGGTGPLGLSRLSVWWLRLGVRVHFSRPACPQDNGAHEQMHAVLKRETTRPTAPSVAAQQRRFDRWRKLYNEVRPHDRLNGRTPGTQYRPSARPFPATLPAWLYRDDPPLLVPGANGRAWWRGRQRMIGRAFAGEHLALRSITPSSTKVFLGPWLIGTLHTHDPAGLRPARWKKSRGSAKGGG